MTVSKDDKLDVFRQPIFKKSSIVSKQVWQNVELWRPRSCYIYVSRKCLNCPNYRPWNDFRWDDYLQRREMMETFEVRHLPVLRGEEDIPTNYLPDPECWNVDSDDDPESDCEKQKSVKPKKKAKSPRTPSEPVKRKLMWDFELEEWVPNEMGSQVPPTTPTTPSASKGRKKPRKKRKRRVRTPSPSSERSPTLWDSGSSLESFKGVLEP